MKRKFTLLLAAAACIFSAKAQVVFTENFNAPFNPAATGWVLINNSVPVANGTWFQGVGTSTATFPAYNGASDDYMASDYNVGGTSTVTPAGISNWIITPELTIHNGAVLTFATRKITANPQFPDRMQVRMSTAGSTSAIPTGSASVGTFTNLLLDINPLFSNSTASAVANGSVNGYPQTWTIYTLTISGVTGTVTGRYAFRHFMNDGGPAGNNGDYIGLDAVTYSASCNLPMVSVAGQTICSGVTATLVASGANSYSWSSGGTAVSEQVSPTSNTTYTVYGTNQTCTTSQTVEVTVGTNLSVNASANPGGICPGGSATLIATGSATSYSWNTGATTSSIVVNPSSNTTYTVGGINGSCVGAGTVALVVNSNPTVSASSSNSMACFNQTVLLTGSGATSYTWTGLTNPVNSPTVSLNTGTVAGSYTLIVTGANAAGCTATTQLVQSISNCVGINNNSANTSNVNVYPNPFSSELKISGVTGIIKVYNALGQMVLSTSVNENQVINTSDFIKGIYIVKALDSTGKEVKTIRMIKN
ncbi:MAG: Ig family protein [Bacteroidetes bacterium]|jgi:hypothetical protein|nr:Ig family protein [Bacteroidota bacterium]